MNERAAGILLHISSLPGPFGIGDIGPGAYKFAGQLAACGQRYWQLLPINPINEKDFSPYSTIGAMAGNPLFISPELLVTDGLLTTRQINTFKRRSTSKVDYKRALSIKTALLEIAYESFLLQPDHPYHHCFHSYCNEAAYWLNDYATYRVLCGLYGNKPWQEWSEEHCTRNCILTAEQQASLQREKWYQFLFDLQWKNFKKYCNHLGILLFGDLPIYVHPAAADVWAYPDLFEVDEKGKMIGVAGVPPDYFNENGQLWQLPVYNWVKMKETNYDWWIQRMRRNLEWFDILRLDHFRGFSAYWRIPAGEITATNGEWIPGPANDLFDAFKAAFPEMPFVAEDLGLIDDPVRKLRDDYNIPGMRVLQFAFHEKLGSSEHIPHQLNTDIVYFTGTHDTNTTRGWYKEADKTTRKKVKQYSGKKITSRKAPLVLARMAYASIAHTVILPMQDVLCLSGNARMNFPSAGDANWQWRMLENAFTPRMINRLKKWVGYYGREGS